MTGRYVFRHVRGGRGLESWDQFVSTSRRVVNSLPEYQPGTVDRSSGAPGVRATKQPREHAGLSAAELRLAEEAWAALPSFDDLVKGRR